MPFFQRPRPSADQAFQDKLQLAVQHLQEAFEQRARDTRTTTAREGISTAALLTVGAMALAGLTLYATRNPRIPAGVQPVEHFDIDRFLGKWYEVARIEHRFEKGLVRTQAEYLRLPHGAIQVISRGFHAQRSTWKTAYGKAFPMIAPDVGALKVSFFGPFYSGYNVVALDADYQWAMVVGSSLDDFWILCRQPELPTGVTEPLLQQAQQLGVPTEKVIWVHQDGVNPTGYYA